MDLLRLRLAAHRRPVQARLGAGDREGVVLTFMREVPRVPEAQLQLMRSLPAWRARVAAAHTVVRELRAHEKYVFRAEKLAGVRTPVLLLLGGDSPAFFRTGIAAVQAAIPSARLSVMPGQQHAAMDTGPEVFLRAVLGFLGD
jgi:pimeloyl-ACP methyl ester carboxylesterase